MYAKVKNPVDGHFFVTFYDDDDHPYEIRRFDAGQFQNLRASLIAAAQRRLGMHNLPTVTAIPIQSVIITNHVGELCLMPDIQNDDEAKDILDGHFHEFHYFDIDE